MQQFWIVVYCGEIGKNTRKVRKNCHSEKLGAMYSIQSVYLLLLTDTLCL